MEGFEGIVNFLRDGIGLSKLEVEIYIELLRRGTISISKLSRHIGIHRAKTNRIVDNLVKLGIISKVRNNNVWGLTAEKPICFNKLIREKRIRIEDHERHFESIIKGFNTIFPCLKETTSFPVKYYTGKTSVWNIYEKILKSSDMYSISDIDSYYQVYPGTASLWNEAFIKNPSRTIFEITLDTPLINSIISETYDFQHSYNAKLIPTPNFNYTRSDIIAFENSIAFINLNPTKPTATVIHSSIHTNNFIQIHQTLWNML